MDNSKQSKQVLLSVIGVAILVVAVVGVSFAFFNYTRTGQENTVSTGKIKFVSTQNKGVALTNVFPLNADQLATDAAGANHDEVVISISGATTYSQGLDWRVVATDVDFTAGSGASAVTLPVNVEVTQSGLNTNEGDTVSTTSYTSASPLANYNVLASGHIAPVTVDAFTGTNTTGTVTVKVYIDAGKIAITDTLTTDTAPEGHANGTTGTPGWVNGRLRVTTDQWNELTSEPLTFKMRVESKETGGTYIDHNN